MECFASNGSNGEVLVFGSSEGHLYFMLLPELQCLRIVDLTANGAIRSLRFSEGRKIGLTLHTSFTFYYV